MQDLTSERSIVLLHKIKLASKYLDEFRVVMKEKNLEKLSQLF